MSKAARYRMGKSCYQITDSFRLAVRNTTFPTDRLLGTTTILEMLATQHPEEAKFFNRIMVSSQLTAHPELGWTHPEGIIRLWAPPGYTGPMPKPRKSRSKKSHVEVAEPSAPRRSDPLLQSLQHIERMLVTVLTKLELPTA